MAGGRIERPLRNSWRPSPLRSYKVRPWIPWRDCTIPRVLETLLSGWKGYTPKLRSRVLDVLLQRVDGPREAAWTLCESSASCHRTCRSRVASVCWSIRPWTFASGQASSSRIGSIPTATRSSWPSNLH